MRRAALVVAVVAALGLLTGCRVMLGDFNKYGERYEPPPMSKVAIGDSKAAVMSALGEPNAVVGIKQTDRGFEETLEWWQYKATFGRDEIEVRHHVFLRDDKVTGWESIASPN